jgi:tetratricopeptide (TPR) repeat protein
MAALTYRSSPLRWPLLLIAAIAVVFLAGRLFAPGQYFPGPPDRTPTTGSPQSYDAALSRIDAIIDGSRVDAAQHRDEWLVQEKLASDLMGRAHLTGSFDDYAEAQRALDQGFAYAAPGTGPHFAQAGLDFTMHRLARTEKMVDAISHYAIPDRGEQAEAAQIRADIAFYRGDYAGAWRRYAAPGASPFRQAVYYAHTGKPDEAIAAIDKAERQSRFATANLLSNFALQRGGIELQRGRWDEASADFDHAARLFPGSWLIGAHQAQMIALKGDLPDAAHRLEAIIARNPAPEAIDLLASIYRQSGDYRRSKIMVDRASAIWAKRLQQFPEAAYGHAVEHELAFGNPARALMLARADYIARPYGATAVALGWAQLANNDPAGALRTVTPVLASAWESPEQHLLASQALARLGRGADAEAEEAKAVALNPRVRDANGTLIWFGHN